jgi:pyridoxal 5'-phosphate synthase pdxT subunit
VPVLVRQGPVLAASFHPELTDDHRIHEWFVSHFVSHLVSRFVKEVS